MNTTITDLFEEDLDMPDPNADRRYAQLVGLDHIKDRLAKEAELILQPARIEQWSTQHHGDVLAAVRRMEARPPLFVFEGDIGSGKTTLAETFASSIARRHGINVKVRRLSLRSRGSGTVGEMTRLIGMAFDLVVADARKHTTNRPTVLVVDEADALAQSREAAQMHHEDRAGVNALIRGINMLTAEPKLATLIVLCTNRPGALDPAVRRRAAAEFSFGRPGHEQRRLLLSELITGAGFQPSDIDQIVSATGPTTGRCYGYAYSDLVDRLIPAAVLAAYPDRPLTPEIVLDQVRRHPPTKPFTDQA
jgi:AAA+ superfamily predicted ATPase